MIETIGDCTLYLGDCREILPSLANVDACVTDPPYGIGADEAASKNKGKWGWKYYGETAWDRERPAREVFELIRTKSKEQIIWGGNYFTDYPPPSMQWLIWDKGQRDFSLADFEMAWSSQHAASRVIDYARGSALGDGKQHPTQKPVAVMGWCLEQIPKAKTILDPFMGVASTGVACVRLGRRFTGIEIEPKYYEIALKRIEAATKEPRLPLPEPRMTQTSLLDGER
jgi:hypothetical protein